MHESGADSWVRCPYHDSEFSLSIGALLHGPATAPAAAFESRVADGMLQVRLTGAGQETRPGDPGRVANSLIGAPHLS